MMGVVITSNLTGLMFKDELMYYYRYCVKSTEGQEPGSFYVAVFIVLRSQVLLLLCWMTCVAKCHEIDF